MEPYLEKRIEAAKQKAKQIANAKIETEEDLRLVFQFILCQKYNIPIFDSYFEDRTLDELMFEVYLHKESSVRSDPELAKQEAADLIKQEANKDEYWEDLEEFEQTDDEFLKQARRDFSLDKKDTKND